MIKQLILEEVYGNIVVAYHRTKVEDIIDKVYDTGWIPGSGRMYGAGFYGTFTLQSQLRDGMIGYGPVIGKFRIDINNFVIFEWDVFQKTKMREYPKANEDNFIELQLRKYGIIKTQEDIGELYNTIGYVENSSNIAYRFFNLETKNTKLVDGIIFHGANDGDVIVCFDLSLIHPLGYSIDEGQTFIKPSEFIKQYHNKGFKNKYINPKDKISNANITKGDILIMIDKNPSLAKMYPNIINDISGEEWTDFYYKYPELIDKYPQGLDKLHLENLFNIYIKNPELIDKYPQGLDKLDGDYLNKLYNKDPELIDKYPQYLYKLSGHRLFGLYSKNPELINKYVKYLKGDHWSTLYYKHPELIYKYPQGLAKLDDVKLFLLYSNNRDLLTKYPKYLDNIKEKAFVAELYVKYPELINIYPQGLNTLDTELLNFLLEKMPNNKTLNDFIKNKQK